MKGKFYLVVLNHFINQYTSKIMKTLLFILSLVSSMAIMANNDEVAEEGVPTIPLKISFADDGKVVPNTTIYLFYLNLEKTVLVEKEANTGDGGTVTFDLPLDKDGASCAFVVYHKKEDADEVKGLKPKTTIRAFRTPPGEKCEFLQLTLSKSGSMKNDGCAIQMWSINIPNKEAK